MARKFSMWLVGAVAIALAFPAAAQWKWRDGSGRTQYSDLPPPPGTPEQNILSRPAAQRRADAARPRAEQAPAAVGVAASAAPTGMVDPAAGTPPLAPKGADAELEARRKKAEQEQQAKTKAEETRLATARAENCTRARSQLQTLESGMRVARMNDKGEREFLDDKARGDEARRTQAIISSDCK